MFIVFSLSPGSSGYKNKPSEEDWLTNGYCVNQNLAGLPSVKPGITELTFAGGNATLTHNAGFPDSNYVVMFICSNVRMFPRMCTNIDGNKTTLSASAVNGSGDIAHLEGKYQVMWIVARGA